MSFPRHREIYPSDGGAAGQGHAPAHRADEFPAGYSSAGWSPPEPASASPAGFEYASLWFCRSSGFQRTANCVLTACVSQGAQPSQVRVLVSEDDLRPHAVAAGNDGCVFFSSIRGSNGDRCEVYKVDISGRITLLANGLVQAMGLTFNSKENVLYALNFLGRVKSRV